MTECRFFPECARCNEVGDSWFPCEGGADGMRCSDYAPMPDVDALLELADRMETMAGMGALLTADGLEMEAVSIREALGVES